MMPATSMVPPPAGFNSIQARTREQRIAVKDKEQWEKARLRQRKEGHTRIETSATGSAMLVYTPGSQGFMSDADRFHSDTAGEERVAREDRHARERINQERKRYDNVQREVGRWKAMDAAAAEEAQKWQAYRVAGTKALRNKSGVAYNPVTLQYNDGKDGERLRVAHEAIKRRAVSRAENLQHQNSRAGVNPITGEPIRRIQVEHLLPPPT